MTPNGFDNYFTEYGMYALGLFACLLAAAISGALLFGFVWVLWYHPAWIGVAAFVMVLFASYVGLQLWMER